MLIITFTVNSSSMEYHWKWPVRSLRFVNGMLNYIVSQKCKYKCSNIHTSGSSNLFLKWYLDSTLSTLSFDIWFVKIGWVFIEIWSSENWKQNLIFFHIWERWNNLTLAVKVNWIDLITVENDIPNLSSKPLYLLPTLSYFVLRKADSVSKPKSDTLL